MSRYTQKSFTGGVLSPALYSRNDLAKLRESVDALIVIPNDKLLEIVDRRTTMPDALRKADEVLQQAVQGITDLINLPAIINLDFADVQTVMKDKGIAHIGIGAGKGDDKAADAVKMAVESPLLETTISGATHVIINVSGDITLADAADAADYVQNLAGDDVNIIFGAMYDENASDSCTITVIATGLETGMTPRITPNNFQTYKTPQVKPTANINVASVQQGAQAVNIPQLSGIRKPGDLKSSVEEKTLSIPSFLQKK